MIHKKFSYWTLDEDMELLKAASKAIDMPLGGSSEAKVREYLKKHLTERITINVSTFLEWKFDKYYERISEYFRCQFKAKDLKEINYLLEELRVLFGEKTKPARGKRTYYKSKNNEIVTICRTFYKELDKTIKFTNPNPQLLNEKKRTIRGNAGLEWLIDNKLALYVYPNIDNADYARMYLDIVDYTNRKGIPIDSLLGKRLTINQQKLYEVFPESKDWLPLSEEWKPVVGESPVSIITNIMLAELLCVIRDMLEREKIKHNYKLSKESSRRYKDLFDSHKILNNTITKLIENRIIKKNAIKDDITDSFSQLISFVADSKVLDSPDCKEEYRVCNIESAQAIISKIRGFLSKINELRVPPFYIRMHVLFELYVYVKVAKLCERLPYNAEYQYLLVDRCPDIVLLKDHKIQFIIDAKYKKEYNEKSVLVDDDQKQAEDFLKNSTAPIFFAYVSDTAGDFPSNLNSFLEDNKKKVTNVSSDRVFLISVSLPRIQ